MYSYLDIPHLMLDLDGVVADFTTGYIAVGKKLYPDFDFDNYTISDWDMSNWFDGFTNEMHSHIFVNVDYSKLPVTDEFNDIMNLLNEERDGRKVVKQVKVVTSRPMETSVGQTVRWLLKNKVRYDEIIFTRDKWKYCNDVSHIMEDKQSNVDDILNHYPNITVIPVPRPYNNQ